MSPAVFHTSPLQIDRVQSEHFDNPVFGRGTTGKVAAVGAKVRATSQFHAQVVEATGKATRHDFVDDMTDPGTSSGQGLIRQARP